MTPNSRNTEINLRLAREDELGEIAQLMVAAYSEYEQVVSPEIWKAYREDIVDLQGRAGVSEIVVAVVEERLVGCVTFYADGSRAGWPGDYSYIRLLAVHPEVRGAGVGRILTEECIRRARELGRRYLGLHTTNLMTIARDMYERMGFERVPDHDSEAAQDIQVMGYRFTL